MKKKKRKKIMVEVMMIMKKKMEKKIIMKIVENKFKFIFISQNNDLIINIIFNLYYKIMN